nr:hypothetical protein JVH1_4529 [Rhodococcus sp. JVH1]
MITASARSTASGSVLDLRPGLWFRVKTARTRNCPRHGYR